MAEHGEIQALFAQKVLRTDAHDDTGFGVEGVSVPLDSECERYCRMLVKDLGYHGAGCVQFLIDEVGDKMRPWFLELNPRLDATCAIAYYCGFDFPKWAVECSLGKASSSSRRNSSYPLGRTSYWLYGDFTSVLHEFRARKLSLSQLFIRWVRMSALTLTSSHHLVWSFSDPMPSVVLWVKELPSSLLRGLRARLT